ncbi:MAG: hypothetical protein Q9159_003718 [Coniocarpon cinnabarinum]
MDPATAIGLISAIGEIVHAIYAYGTAVKEASKEIARLRSELFGLKAALEQIASDIHGQFSQLSLNDSVEPSAQAASGQNLGSTADSSALHLSRSDTLYSQSTDRTLVNDGTTQSDFSPFLSPILNSEETARTFEDAKKLLDELAKALGSQPRTRVGRIVQRAAWPLKKAETDRIADHLERLKTYFILAVTSDNLSVCRQVYWEVRALRRDVEDQAMQTDLQALRRDAADWLSPVEPYIFQSRLISNRLKGTGEWFVRGHLVPWLSGDKVGREQLIWLKGKPGSGKSTLFSAFKETKEGSGSQFQTAELPALERLLIDTCRQLPRLILLLDALNESAQANQTIRLVFAILGKLQNVQALITSTEETNILGRRELVTIKSVNMNTDPVYSDIKAYIDVCESTIPVLQRSPKTLRNDVKAELLSRSDGSYDRLIVILEKFTR